jgi:4-hydroxybenzoyl-CoA thioesterase
MAFVQERIIEWGDCDAAGIVYYPNYFRWIDGCFHALGRAAGFDQMSLGRDFGLMGTPLMESSLKFVSPGRYHDSLRIEARITRLGGSGLTVAYALSIDGRAVAQGHEARAFVAEVEGRLRPAPIPTPIRAALEAYLG